MVVRATSPNVPIWGKPDGPYPVSKMMAPVGFGIRFKRLRTLRASSKGQALLTWACANSSELISIFGVRALLLPRAPSSASGMLASACGSDLRGLDLVGLACG